MPAIRTLLAQVALSVLVTSLVVPVLVVAIPTARTPGVGLPVAAGVLAGTFIVFRVLWPRKNSA